MVAKILIEDCTEVHLYVGKAINSAYQNPGLPFDLGIRQNLVEQLRHLIEDMGKRWLSPIIKLAMDPLGLPRYIFAVWTLRTGVRDYEWRK